MDQISPILNPKKTYQNWCDAGISSIEFAEDLTNGHFTESIVGAPAALTWIIDRFSNKPPVDGCQHVVRTTNYEYPNVSSSILDYFKAAMDVVAQQGLGPNIQKDQLEIKVIYKLLVKLFLFLYTK